MSSAPALLVGRSLTRHFGTTASGFALYVDWFCLRSGDTVAVVGPSGCGKSTFLGLLALALRPSISADDGCLRMVGVDAFDLWEKGRMNALADLRAQAIGFVPQTAALLSFLSLRENITLPQTISNRPDRPYINQLAEWLRIIDQMGRRPSQVSVGQRQRAAIARALAHKPYIILADEPTASVHPSQADEILTVLRALAVNTGSALVVTTHDVDRVRAAGFAVAACVPHPGGASTSLSWEG